MSSVKNKKKAIEINGKDLDHEISNLPYDPTTIKKKLEELKELELKKQLKAEERKKRIQDLQEEAGIIDFKWTGSKAIIQYSWDKERMICDLKKIQTVKPVFIYRKTNESFLLNRPYCSIQGIPVFLLLRGFPVSISLDLKDDKLIVPEKGYSSQEIQVMNESHYKLRLFGKHARPPTDFVIFTLWTILIIAFTYIFCQNLFGG